MFYAICLIAWFAVLAGVGAPAAQAERRLALSVGIDVYDNLSALEQLQKAVNDARAMGVALRELGFETAVEENLAKVPFARAWQRFLNRLEAGDTAALFFAGHGVEIGGLNYLLPRDVPKVVPGEDQVLAAASIRFNELMDNLRDKKVGVALFIIDACRDNPFRDGGGRSVGGARGLARVEAAEGTFVMYSAGVGQQALDRLPGGADRNPNSVYTRTLLPILKTPGLSLRDIAGRVQDEVIEAARTVGLKQTPAYYDQAVGRLVLKAGAAGSSTVVDGASLKSLQDGYAKWTALAEPVRSESEQAYIARMKQLVALAQQRSEPHWISGHWAIGVWHGHVKAAKLGAEGTARALNVANVKNDGSVFGGWTASSSRAFGLGAKISVQGDRIHVRTQQFSIVTLQKSGNDRLVGTFKLRNGNTYTITLVRQ